MANKFVTADLIILEATDPTKNKYMINISPWELKLKANDTLYLIIRKGNLKDTFYKNVTSSSYVINNGEKPIEFKFDEPIVLKVPDEGVGKHEKGLTLISDSILYDYALKVIVEKEEEIFTFLEDPKIQIDN